MARTYAGILGPLAFLTSLAQGFIHARQTEAILFAAWCSLLVFAAVGYFVGWIASRTVEESVAARIRAQLRQEEESTETSPAAGADG